MRTDLMPVGDYSDELKAETLAALEANQGNVARTSRETKVPASTIRDWRDGVGTRALSAELRDQKRESLSDRLSDIAENILDSISDKDIEKATLVQKTTAVGILIDKSRLLQNQPTEINETRQSVDDLRSSLHAKLAKISNGEAD